MVPRPPALPKEGVTKKENAEIIRYHKANDNPASDCNFMSMRQ